jgi:hypothetical protein
MRFRTAAITAVSVVTLMLTVSGVASASEGEFTYRYYDDDGEIQVGELVDPPSRECVDIPEVIESSDAHAFRPHNRTDSAATVFKGGNCAGNAHYPLRSGGRAGDRLLIRSVVFS